MARFTKEIAFGAVVLAVLLTLPAITDNKWLLDFAVRVGIFSIFALSLNLLIGNTGLVSFGHGMFIGSGAYAFGIIMQRYAMPLPLAALLAVLISTALAAVTALACARLKHVYFSFLTLAIQMLFHAVILSWSSLTGGDQGLLGGVPRPPFLGINLVDPVQFFRTAVIVFFVLMLAMRAIVLSPFGHALRLIRDNEERATAIGINTGHYRFAVFVIAGAIASVAGVLLCIHNSGAFPEFAYWTVSGDGIFMVMLGGAQSFLGPVLGAILLILLSDVVTSYTSHYGLFLGATILVAVLVLRKGLLDFLSDHLSRRSKPKSVAQPSPAERRADVAP